MTSIQMPLTDDRPIWKAAQWTGLGLTVVLLAGLVKRPELTLHILWNMVIPILPAVFLINPMIWRNVCPLATLNTITGERQTVRPIGTPLMVAAWAIGIVLLALMVPARRFVFNENGVVLAITIAVVGLLALVLGVMVSRRGGFCNTLCPVLPVEKLYGQAPLLKVGSTRCGDCNLCTPAGCIDLAGKKSARQSLKMGEGIRWFFNPFGIFVAAFPGFVIGYFNTENRSLSGAGGIYLQVLAWAAGSLAVVVLLVAITRAKVAVALPLLGGISAGLYYWFGAPALAEAYGLGGVGSSVVRVLALGLVLLWLRPALRRELT